MSARNFVTKRWCVAGMLISESPLLIGSGSNERADSEWVRSWDGVPMMPASSMAGCIRDYLTVSDDDKARVLSWFGSEEDKTAAQSRFVFFDAPCENSEEKLDIRDGIMLDDPTRTAIDKSKYDYEILQAGARFPFRCLLEIRQNDSAEDGEALLCSALHGLMDGVIPMGSKRNRGLGVVKLTELQLTSLDMSQAADRDEWTSLYLAESDCTFRNTVALDTLTPLSDFNPAQKQLSVTFNLNGPLLIRQGNKSPQGADCCHLHSNGQPVLPGTVWAGVLRAACERAGRAMGCSAAMTKCVDDLFGLEGKYFRKAHDQKDAPMVSRLRIVGESCIAGGTDKTVRRNRIDRFTGGTVDGALFDANLQVGGSVTLTLAIRNLQHADYGLLYLALKELDNGVQPLGGEVSVGRGLLKLASAPDWPVDEDAALKALASKLSETHVGKDA